MKRNRDWNVALFGLSSLWLCAACGSFDEPTGQLAQEAKGGKGKAQQNPCTVDPNPVARAETYTVSASGLGGDWTLRVEITESSGTHSIAATSAPDGTVRVESTATGLGAAHVSIFRNHRQRERLVSSCSFEVVEAPPPCVPSTCADLGLDCGSADDGCGGVLDCGACPPPEPNCGDGTCDAAEDCSSCSTDCGACPPPEPTALVCEWPTGYEHNSCCWREDASYSNCNEGLLCCDSLPRDHTDPTTWPSGWSAFEEQVLVLVNEHRATGYDCAGSYGYYPPAGPLTMNDALREAARRHSIDQSVHSYVGHIGSDGSWPADRAIDAGYTGAPSLENAGGGYGPWDSGPYAELNNRSPEVIVANWMASPGHCKTIMRAHRFDDPSQAVIDEVGIGYTNMNRSHDPDLSIDTMVSHRRWTLIIGASNP